MTLQWCQNPLLRPIKRSLPWPPSPSVCQQKTLCWRRKWCKEWDG